MSSKQHERRDQGPQAFRAIASFTFARVSRTHGLMLPPQPCRCSSSGHADAGAPAVLAFASLAVMLADARAPAVLAGAPLAVMLADARAPAVLAVAPLAVMLADARAPARV